MACGCAKTAEQKAAEAARVEQKRLARESIRKENRARAMQRQTERKR